MQPECVETLGQTKPEVHYVSQHHQRKRSHGHRLPEPAPKFGEVQPCGFRVMRVERQTDRQTYSLQYDAPLPAHKRLHVAHIRCECSKLMYRPIGLLAAISPTETDL